MSVRFVVGRAGSGKTWRCLEAIRARLRASAIDGPRLLLIVPEQASFQMERALIETPDLPGCARCEVLSFQRLAHRIFATTGADPRRGDQTIGRFGRLMALRRLIRRERSGLRLFDRVADKPGFVSEVAGTLDELMRECVEPETLAVLATQIDDQHPLAAARLGDLTRLYRAYLDYLIDDRMDPAQYLQLAAVRVEQCAWLAGADVWLDGFAGFTQQEYALLARLAGMAAEMEITLLVDPWDARIEATELPKMSYSLFARTERTLMRLRQALHQAGVEVADLVRLAPVAGPRYQRDVLNQLEQHLFSEDAKDPPDDHTESPDGDSVTLLSMPDRRAEVQAAVAEIERLVHQGDPPMRYRDIAVIVRDLAAYHDLLSATMRACGIPYFIDRRQPTTHHPLIELVRALLALVEHDCAIETVRHELKTGLLPIEDDDGDLLENYLVAHGLAGFRAWDNPWAFKRMFRTHRDDHTLSPNDQAVLDQVNTVRKRWLDLHRDWIVGGREAGDITGREWAVALMACLQRLDAPSRLMALADVCEADGRTEEADAHRQVWSDFADLMDEFVHALGTEPMAIEAFREAIEAGLAEFSLGLAPPTLDQVLIGAIERSRHPPLRAVLMLGFDEQHYPMRRSTEPLLGDDERELLESVSVHVGPSRRRQLLDERMLAYIAMTRARERLWISYPRADGDGRPIEPSPFLRDLQLAVPGLEVREHGEAGDSRDMSSALRVSDLGARLAWEFRSRPQQDEESDAAGRARMNALYDLSRQQDAWRTTLRRCLSGLNDRNHALLEPDVVKHAFKLPFRASVSRLERFANCPFQHFAEYMLRLEPRFEAELSRIDLGNVCHTMLEQFIKQLADAGESLGDLEDDEIATRLEAVANDIVPQVADNVMLDDARNAYMIDRSRGHLQRVTAWQRNAARLGSFRPKAVEFPFGLSKDGTDAITLTTPAGRTILLRGYIDRVDVAELQDTLLGLVIDYKHTTDRRLNLTEVYHGLSLQLVGYLLALKQVGHTLAGRPILPVAAFFLPLLEAYQSVNHPSEEKKETYKFRGLADSSQVGHLDPDAASTVGSKFISGRMTKDGRPDSRSDLASPEEMSALIEHVGRKMGELADRLLDGEIEVMPYRLQRKTPCSWCSFQPVCRFEADTQPAKLLDPFDKRTVLAKVTEEQADD